jgi:hypothetical protein
MINIIGEWWAVSCGEIFPFVILEETKFGEANLVGQ